MAWARRMDEGLDPDENEDPGARLDRFRPSGRKKTGAGGLVGRVSRDALMAERD
jgi:hypothetical protein